MHSAKIAIIGAGLSGLYAAYLLEKKGVRNYVILEAKPQVGGRIETLPSPAMGGAQSGSNAAFPGGYDLGPTWYWPAFQGQLASVISELNLQPFAQYESGDMMVERSANGSPVRMRGYLNSPSSMRLVGGMGSLIEALRARVNSDRLHTGQTVKTVRSAETHVEIDSEDAEGKFTTWQVSHVLIALPPRLAAETIEFAPALPKNLSRQWSGTATWMAPHAKYLAIYDRPFWRDEGLSGEARSVHGPLGEIHDASMPDGRGALFGFFSVPAQVRRGLDSEALLSLCRAQFGRLFGPSAMHPVADHIKDWSADPYTSTALDLDGSIHHAAAPLASTDVGPWRGFLSGIGSEWSTQFPGYVAGAIEAAASGVDSLPQSLVLEPEAAGFFQN